VANAHDGLIADVSYSKGWENASSRFGVYPYIGATYYGKDTVNYYYGVRDNEVTDTRAAYSVADGVVDPYAGVALYYALTDRWELEMDINHEWLDDDITDSPLVDADDSTTFGIAVTFKIY
jgi:outer membrane protein